MGTTGLFRGGLALIGTLLLAQVTAQTPRAKGLIFNASKYQQAVKLRDLEVRGGGLRELPLRVSLRPFCPTPQDQGAEPSCTAWAIAYGALTIQQTIQRRITHPADVDKMACSKSFVFNQITGGDPANVPSIETVFDFLKARGTCLAATFRNDLPVTATPDALAADEARSRRVVSTMEVYDPDTTIALRRQIQRFRRLLADSLPVVVGLRLPYSFANLTDKVFRYDPAEPLDSSAHALCLIGYDDVDSTFECLNSWGTTWGGDQGFVRLRYADLFAMLCCAYRLTPQFAVEKKSTALKGSAVLRRSIGYNDRNIPQFEEIRVRYDSVQRHYQILSGKWPAGAGFQLALREAPRHWLAYVFSVDEHQQVTIFHRKLVDQNRVETVIPGEETKFELDESDTAWIGILYSKEPLPDFQEPLQAWLQAQPGSIGEKTMQYFKNSLTTPPLLTPYRMGFTFARQAPGQAALLLLKIEGD
jgi:Papain family cysteine protease